MKRKTSGFRDAVETREKKREALTEMLAPGLFIPCTIVYAPFNMSFILLDFSCHIFNIYIKV